MIFEEYPQSQQQMNFLIIFQPCNPAKRGKRILDRETKLKAEESMLLTAANILSDNLVHIVKKFPSFEQMPPFYIELQRYLWASKS